MDRDTVIAFASLGVAFLLFLGFVNLPLLFRRKKETLPKDDSSEIRQ